MSSFKIHDIESAPDASKPLLENSVKAFGRIPNLHAVMAESPEHLEAYKTLHSLFERTSLSKVERNVVWMTINVENSCHYCVPAHTAIALMQGVDGEIVDALRAGSPLKDSRLEALRQFTLALVRQRGRLKDPQVAHFMEAGFTQRHILDVLLGLAHKTLSNYANHLAETPVDEAFAKFEWHAPA